MPISRLLEDSNASADDIERLDRVSHRGQLIPSVSLDRVADLGAKFFAEVCNRVLDAKLCVALFGRKPKDNQRGTRHGPT